MTTTKDTSAPVTVTFVGSKPVHPPITQLLLDVHIRNTADGPRWFLLPGRLGAEEPFLEMGVWGAEAFELPGDARVVVGRFGGGAGFQAFHVPAGADLTIKRFTLDHFDPKVGGDVDIPMLVGAETIRVGEDDAAKWFGVPHTSAAKAVVDGEKGELVGSHETADLSPVPVATRGGARTSVTVHVDLTKR